MSGRTTCRLPKCAEFGIECHVGRIGRRRAKGESQEEYWRNERYAFFEKFKASPIVTCHHLGDAVETWVMSSLHGEGKLIPYRNARYNIMRPFLCTPKSEIEDWAERHGVEYVTDGSNFDRYRTEFLSVPSKPVFLIIMR